MRRLSHPSFLGAPLKRQSAGASLKQRVKGVFMKEVKQEPKIFIENKQYNQTWAELYKTLQDLLDRRQALLEQVQEFKQIDDALKNYFSGVSVCHIGPYKVHGQEVEEESFTLPNKLKNKYLHRDKKWKVEISKI